MAGDLSDVTTEQLVAELAARIAALPLAEQVDALNQARAALHEVSPFRAEPVDLVTWVLSDGVKGNGYNPNSVAPPEMKLLAHSIRCDGYTQPIVAWPADGALEVVDGYHRNRVGKEVKDVRARVHGYLPVVQVKSERTAQADRMAATVRHNRARGKHAVSSMSDMVASLHQGGWTDEQIAHELGMDADEVLRLKQVTGLAALFKDRDYSAAWEPA